MKRRRAPPPGPQLLAWLDAGGALCCGELHVSNASWRSPPAAEQLTGLVCAYRRLPPAPGRATLWTLNGADPFVVVALRGCAPAALRPAPQPPGALQLTAAAAAGAGADDDDPLEAERALAARLAAAPVRCACAPASLPPPPPAAATLAGLAAWRAAGEAAAGWDLSAFAPGEAAPPEALRPPAAAAGGATTTGEEAAAAPPPDDGNPLLRLYRRLCAHQPLSASASAAAVERRCGDRTALCCALAWSVPTPAALSLLRSLNVPLLDAGCGTGYWAALLAARGADVEAVDQPPSGGGPPARHRHPAVRPGCGVAAAAATRRPLLLLCWPDPVCEVGAGGAYAGEAGRGFGAAALAAFRGPLVAHVGELGPAAAAAAAGGGGGGVALPWGVARARRGWGDPFPPEGASSSAALQAALAAGFEAVAAARLPNWPPHNAHLTLWRRRPPPPRAPPGPPGAAGGGGAAEGAEEEAAAAAKGAAAGGAAAAQAGGGGGGDAPRRRPQPPPPPPPPPPPGRHPASRGFRWLLSAATPPAGPGAPPPPPPPPALAGPLACAALLRHPAGSTAAAAMASAAASLFGFATLLRRASDPAAPPLRLGADVAARRHGPGPALPPGCGCGGGDSDGDGGGPPPAATPALLRRLHDGCGCTLQVRAPQRFAPGDGLWALAAAMEAALGCLVGCSAYLSPAAAAAPPGLAPHWDDVDVWVVHTHGAKAWRVWRPAGGGGGGGGCDGPRPRRPSGDLDAAALGPPWLEAVLRPGDVLCIPRGWPHAAAAVAGAGGGCGEGGGAVASCAHLTLSSHQRWDAADLAAAAVATMADGPGGGGGGGGCPAARRAAAAALAAPLPPRALFAAQSGGGGGGGSAGGAAAICARLAAAALRAAADRLDPPMPPPPPPAAAAAAAAAGRRRPRRCGRCSRAASAALSRSLDALAVDFFASRLPPPCLRPAGPRPTSLAHLVTRRGAGLARVVAGPTRGTVRVLHCLANDRARHMMAPSGGGGGGPGLGGPSDEGAEGGEEAEEEEDGESGGDDRADDRADDEGPPALVFPASFRPALAAALLRPGWRPAGGLLTRQPGRRLGRGGGGGGGSGGEGPGGGARAPHRASLALARALWAAGLLAAAPRPGGGGRGAE